MAQMVGFEWGPNTRGTIDIVWGCVLVLVTAVWTVVHANIPGRGDGFWRVVLRQLRWGCVSVFAPDFLTLVAAAQWDAASRSVAAMRALPRLRDDPGAWRLEHAFYANSGGCFFALARTIHLTTASVLSQTPSLPPPTAFLLQCPDCRPFPVSAASLHCLVSRGYVALPDLPAPMIRDRSRADVFAKGAAVLQGAWLEGGAGLERQHVSAGRDRRAPGPWAEDERTRGFRAVQQDDGRLRLCLLLDLRLDLRV